MFQQPAYCFIATSSLTCCLFLGPEVGPDHLRVAPDPDPALAHVHPPSDAVAQSPGAPPLRMFTLWFLIRFFPEVLFLFYNG